MTTTAPTEPTLEEALAGQLHQAIDQLIELTVTCNDEQTARVREVIATLTGIAGMVPGPMFTAEYVDAATTAARLDERRQVADLLEANAGTLSSFAVDQEALVGLLAFMLRMGTG